MTRTRYWIFIFGGVIALACVWGIARAFSPPEYIIELGYVSLSLTWITFFVFVVILRIHDIGRGHWPALLIFVPFGLLILGLVPAKQHKKPKPSTLVETNA